VVDWTVIRRPGLQQIPITVVNNDRDVDLVDAPTSIEADVDRLDTASVPVRVHVVRTPPAGYTIVSGPTVTPDHVVVSGPQRRLVGLVATVDVDLSNWKGAFSRNLPVTLVDPQGNPVTDVGLVNANTVHVEIGIVSVTASRDVGITLTTVGSPALGHYLASVQIEPLLVRITGPQDILNGLDTVPTQAINLNGLSADRVVVVGLQLPVGVTAQPALVTVRLGVATLSAPSPLPQPSASPTGSPSSALSPTPAPSPSGSPGHGPVP
jgi:YbbR domain-containing protein